MRAALLIAYTFLLEIYRRMLFSSDASMIFLFVPGTNYIRKFSGIARAYTGFWLAKRKVPAYRDFLQKNNFSKPSFKGMIPNLQEIPVMDKENYVKAYDIDARCIGGRIPDKGVIIDESSGSSGTPTNWVRGPFERRQNARMIKFGIRNLFGKGPLFIINAFALGPWATGVNITISCVTFSKLKSLGPDRIKIENTLKQFGKNHKYIIMGYPPFLKMLVDQSEINWKEYDVSFIFGGESMSEGLRDYLREKGIPRIYSSLGASDLELNISAENDFTISLRRMIRSNAELQKRLLRFTGALPMIFQFHPADFLLESSPQGELIISICRPGYISPKIRYNLHDRGHVVEMKELYAILDELKIDKTLLVQAASDLPMLFHYGRADMTVSFYGSNISPVDINEVIYLIPDLAKRVSSFYLATPEDKHGNKELVVHFELLQDAEILNGQHATIEKEFFRHLEIINQDFRESNRIANNEKASHIEFHKHAHGIFADNDIRIKSKYLN